MMRVGMRATVVTVMLAMVLNAPAGAQRRDAALDDQPSAAAQLGWGMASFGTNLGYMPAKILYAFTGGLIGLLAWGFTAGDDNVARGIWDPAFGGTWAVTPEMLQGKQPIMFTGPSYEP